MKLPIDVVLCPTDLSPVGASAVPVAYAIVAEGGVVHLLHVVETKSLANPLYAHYGRTPTPEEMRAEEDRVRRQLHALVPSGAALRNVRTEYHVVPGADVVETIVETAKGLSAGAVVLGTRGRTGLARLMMGSIAADVLKYNLPVVLVHEDVGEPE